MRILPPSTACSLAHWALLGLLCTATAHAIEYPLDLSAKVGQTANFSYQAFLDNGGNTCEWHKNGAIVTTGTSKDANSVWRLSFTVTAADQNAKIYAVVTGTLKEKPVDPITTRTATLTVVPDATVFDLVEPVPNTTVSPVGSGVSWSVNLKASLAVKTWEYSFPDIPGFAFQEVNSAAIVGAQQEVLALPVHLLTGNLKTRIRIAPYPSGTAVVRDFFIKAPQLPPSTSGVATYQAPFFYAFEGTTFTVTKELGLAQFAFDPNGDPLTFAKQTGNGLTINADGSFSWVVPSSTSTFPTGANALATPVLAGTWSVTDAVGPAVTANELRIHVFKNPGDVNRDGVINILDVQAVTSRFGQNPGVPLDP
jgi:hypothetical protein